MKVKIPTKKSYLLLTHGALVLVSTYYKGRPNVQTVAWQMPLDFDPAKVALVIGGDNFTHEAIMKTREFVINVPGAELLGKIVGCGSVSGRDADKFEEFNLTAVKASKVKAPLIKECLGHLECRLIEPKLAEKYDLVLGKVLSAKVEKGTFKDRWLVEKKEVSFAYHLGGESFTKSGGLVKPK